MNGDDILPARTERERAAEYLHRSRPARPKASPQTEALFAEPEQQGRRLVSDDTPTLAQPTIPNYRGSAWVPFSVEIESDGEAFAAEVGRLLQDSVEQLQARPFVPAPVPGSQPGSSAR